MQFTPNWNGFRITFVFPHAIQSALLQQPDPPPISTIYGDEWGWFEVTLYDLVEKHGVPDPSLGKDFTVEFTRVLRRGKNTVILAETDAARHLGEFSLLKSFGTRRFGELIVEYDVRSTPKNQR